MDSIDLSIFPVVKKEQWEDMAQTQLKGKNPYEVLNWSPCEGIELSPYYDKSDIKNITDIIHFFENKQFHRWKLYEEIFISTEKKSNNLAIEALKGGCDGIIFHSEKKIDEHVLLQGIDKSIYDLSIFTHSDLSYSDSFSKMVTQRLTTNCLKVTSAHPVDQLCFIIKNIKNYPYIYRLGLSDFFLETATLRALDYLLDHFFKNKKNYIHTEIPTTPQYEKHWFLNTSIALAAIIGGAHSISFKNENTNRRINRNIGNIIREESGIHMADNQWGGSYFMESFTYQIINNTLKRLKDER